MSSNGGGSPRPARTPDQAGDGQLAGRRPGRASPPEAAAAGVRRTGSCGRRARRRDGAGPGGRARRPRRRTRPPARPTRWRRRGSSSPGRALGVRAPARALGRLRRAERSRSVPCSTSAPPACSAPRAKHRTGSPSISWRPIPTATPRPSARCDGRPGTPAARGAPDVAVTYLRRALAEQGAPELEPVLRYELGRAAISAGELEPAVERAPAGDPGRCRSRRCARRRRTRSGRRSSSSTGPRRRSPSSRRSSTRSRRASTSRGCGCRRRGGRPCGAAASRPGAGYGR